MLGVRPVPGQSVSALRAFAIISGTTPAASSAD
jgi:hypothetical protein